MRRQKQQQTTTNNAKVDGTAKRNFCARGMLARGEEDSEEAEARSVVCQFYLTPSFTFVALAAEAERKGRSTIHTLTLSSRRRQRWRLSRRRRSRGWSRWPDYWGRRVWLTWRSHPGHCSRPPYRAQHSGWSWNRVFTSVQYSSRWYIPSNRSGKHICA